MEISHQLNIIRVTVQKSLLYWYYCITIGYTISILFEWVSMNINSKFHWHNIRKLKHEQLQPSCISKWIFQWHLYKQVNFSMTHFFWCYCHFSVNGGLTNWTPFSTCSKSCGKGSQERTRTCTNPSPQHGGDDCVGDLKESRKCQIKPCPGKIGFLLIFFTTHL